MTTNDEQQMTINDFPIRQLADSKNRMAMANGSWLVANG
jgi:hypothetical protein